MLLECVDKCGEVAGESGHSDGVTVGQPTGSARQDAGSAGRFDVRMGGSGNADVISGGEGRADVSTGCLPEVHVRDVPRWLQDPCVICLDEWVEGARVIGLSCGHHFHKACVLQWALKKRRGSPVCPTCKQDMFRSLP